MMKTTSLLSTLLVIVMMTSSALAFMMPMDASMQRHQQRIVSSAIFMSDGGDSGIVKGTVKWFDSTKGFGFLSRDDGGDDIFVHQTAVQAEGFRSLDEGASVEFQVETGDDGRVRATQVTGPDGELIKRAF